MKRLLFLAAVLLPTCTGCVTYAYPTLVHVPELTVPNPDGSVHAFRVEIDTTVRPPNDTKTQYTLSRIPIDARGLIPSQLELAPATGVYNPFGVTGVAEERTNYTMLVRAYRPGYRTIEVQAWEKSRELMWLPAADLVDQERQVDELLREGSSQTTVAIGSLVTGPNPLLTNKTWWDCRDAKSPPFGLQSGSVSSVHRQALQFAASEYARLANSPAAKTSTMQPVRERLQQKAIWLQRYADEMPLKAN
jgi:hypothetical protein